MSVLGGLAHRREVDEHHVERLLVRLAFLQLCQPKKPAAPPATRRTRKHGRIFDARPGFAAAASFWTALEPALEVRDHLRLLAGARLLGLHAELDLGALVAELDDRAVATGTGWGPIFWPLTKVPFRLPRSWIMS